MNVRSGSRARRGISKGDKWYAGTAQMVNERLPFRAVGMKRDVDGIPVIESHAVMSRSLAVGAYRQLVAEGLGEEFLNSPRFF